MMRWALVTPLFRGAGLLRITLSIATICLGVSLASVPAHADSDGDVNVGGEHILTVRFPSNGYSIKDRAEAITDRLTRILSDANLRPSDIVVSKSGKDAVIRVKDRLLVTVDAQTAHFNQTTPMALGESWARHLRIVLPRVNVRPNPNDERGKL
jgi:hypothetical protein